MTVKRSLSGIRRQSLRQTGAIIACAINAPHKVASQVWHRYFAPDASVRTASVPCIPPHSYRLRFCSHSGAFTATHMLERMGASAIHRKPTSKLPYVLHALLRFIAPPFCSTSPSFMSVVCSAPAVHVYMLAADHLLRLGTAAQ